jgi:hypothetical protein
MKIYLDIDGVLLTRSLRLPKHGREFILFLTDHCDCYWLTTHCRAGGNKAIEYLEKFYDQDIVEKLKLIKKTDWVDKKTEGIDYSSTFIWLDDNPFHSEIVDLKNKNCLGSLIVVDLSNENELKEVLGKIKTRII